MSKQFLVMLAAVIVILGGIFWATSDKSKAPDANSNKPTSHIEGSASSGLKLIEYGDYQCPICGAYYQAVKDTAAKYNDRIQFQFRNLPLTTLHPNAFAAARAAEAAGLQGKYFQMHDLLYQNQTTWADTSNAQAYFDSYAKSLGLNMTKFHTDFASSKVNSAINADLKVFGKTGLDMATPTFFLDGKNIPVTELVDKTGYPSADQFTKLIDAELAKKTQQ